MMGNNRHCITATALAAGNVINWGVRAVTLAGVATGFVVSALTHADGRILTEADWLTEIPNVLSVTRQEQKVTDAPSSVTIITRDMIEALGAANLAEVMRLVPGFQVFYSNGLTFGVTSHGFTDRDPRRLEVRVNGRSVYLPQLSSVAWESIGVLPEDVDHIEVVRGSNVPAYGSNAILGAINIVTRNPVQEAGGRVKVAFSSQGTQTLGGRHSDNVGNTDFSVRFAARKTEGFDGIDDEANTGHLVLNGVIAPNLTDEFNFELGFSKGSFGTGDTDHLDEFSDDDREAAWLSSQWQRSSETQQWKVHFSYSDYTFEKYRQNLVSTEFDVTPDVVSIVFPGHSDELIEVEEGRRDYSVANIELEHHLRAANSLQTVWGVGSRLDRGKSDWLAGDGNTDAVVYYLFGNAEWQMTPDWVLNSGLMLEDKEGFDVESSPRIALTYHFNPDHHWRLGATRAYRQPALMETDRLRVLRFQNGDLIDLQRRSHSDVEPEKVTTYEWGYYGYWFDKRLRLDAKLFREEIRGAIDLIDTYPDICANPDPGIATWLAARYCADFYVDGVYGSPAIDKVRVVANTGDWNVEGVEAQLSWYYSADTWLRLDYTRLSASGKRWRKVKSVSYKSTLDDSAPEYSAGLLFSHQWNSEWRISGYLQYMDFIDWRAGTEVESHTRLDMKLARAWRWGQNEGEIALVGQNLFNDRYLEYQRHNEFERRALVSMTLRWP